MPAPPPPVARAHDAGSSGIWTMRRRRGCRSRAALRCHARFTDEDEAGAFVPGAVSRVAQLGAVLSPQGRWSGAVRWRHFGPRALVEDNTVRSADSNLVSLDAGIRISPRLTIRADVLNAFDSRSSDIDYFYTSRVAGEPAQGVDDVHVHPVEPFTVRLALVLGF
ncbi:MAG: TonB-dependent receptor [Acidobacteria bacterium]|nr:TonB-dependent receptor [Acidobacteriota bacterium]